MPFRTPSTLLLKKVVQNGTTITATRCQTQTQLQPNVASTMIIATRELSTTSSSTSDDDNNNNNTNNSKNEKQQQKNKKYISPFQDIYDTIKENKTFLGTTEFTPPNIKYLDCGVPENVLRFKTVSYGRLLNAPYVQPNEHKVTLQVPTKSIPLSELEMFLLKEIVGTRINEDRGMLQLSSNQFGSRIENKRHAVSMLNRLVFSAKSLAERMQSLMEEEQHKA